MEKKQQKTVSINYKNVFNMTESEMKKFGTAKMGRKFYRC